jgi:peptidoglycan/LPS O-acetylase OafA/YrhL
MISTVIKEKKLSSLNGLRGLSILLVLLSHLRVLNNFSFGGYLSKGGLGVNIFFVLSGFLITTLCIKEIEKTGTLSLKNFYIRRSFRIFPVAFLFIFTIFILNKIYQLGVSKIQFIGALLYLQDFSYFVVHSFTWYFRHLWSLSVEEQFYLIFPFILSRSFKLFMISLLFIIFILPLLFSVQYFVPSFDNIVIYAISHFLIKFQGIAVGCLFAILASRKKLDPLFIFKTKNLTNLIGFVLIFLLVFNETFSLRSVYINLIISFITGCLIINNLEKSNSVFYWFLNSKVMTTIGLLSYSIYIWQQIFTSYDTKLPFFLVTNPYNLVFIVVVPCLSYYFYEKKFLKLKERFSVA